MNISTWIKALKDTSTIKINSSDDLIIALAGNPNTGKSTVFNSLTGLKQHTGNWPGKTVTTALGEYTHKDKTFSLVDLPGTYSLLSNSVEEEIARDFICFSQPVATVVVTDAICLERNLNLALQIMEITDKVVICVNLMDEAKRKKIQINLKELSEILGIPVVGTNARDGEGLNELKDAIYQVATGEMNINPFKLSYNALENTIAQVEPIINEILDGRINGRWVALRLLDSDESILNSLNSYMEADLWQNYKLRKVITETKELLNPNEIRDIIVSSIIQSAESIGSKVVTFENKEYNQLDRTLDNILTSKTFGIPIMLALLGVVFWLTIEGANYPSQLLFTGLFWVEERITDFFIWAGLPEWLHGILVLGAYRTLAWVVSVMLPPMAIFFPLFTLLEDLGYLPRVAFNLDNFFKKACAHGKQALTMCMALGCNAAGVIACRIIDSPRERLIAIITNNFTPCNGRFPTLIALTTIFISSSLDRFQSIINVLTILGTITLSVIITLIVSRILSKTILKGLPSSFTLELPPYRKPHVGRILIRSFLDRTFFVLTRAIIVAAPAGFLVWIMSNIIVGDMSLLHHSARLLQPLAHLIGLDGYILMAFILGFPANEIVIPIIIMSYLSEGAILELHSLRALRDLLIANGWTWLTALCTMLFSLNHFPCGTTLLTIKNETQSRKWTLISFLVPTITGFIICFITAQSVRIINHLASSNFL